MCVSATRRPSSKPAAVSEQAAICYVQLRRSGGSGVGLQGPLTAQLDHPIAGLLEVLVDLA